jgi:hypothetical protein
VTARLVVQATIVRGEDGMWRVALPCRAPLGAFSSLGAALQAVCEAAGPAEPGRGDRASERTACGKDEER